MAIYFLDTSVIIDTLNGRHGRPELLEHLLKQGHLLACCFINVSEVYAGVKPSEESETKTFLESLEFLDITWDIAKEAGLLKRDFARRGVTLSLPDCTIASVAMAHDCTLMTDNQKDFPMKGLELYSF